MKRNKITDAIDFLDYTIGWGVIVVGASAAVISMCVILGAAEVGYEAADRVRKVFK